MKEFQLVDGKTSDGEWLFNLYQEAMLSCIEATWGWDDEFQSNGFSNNLKPTDWKIIRNGNERIGGFVLKESSGHLWLEMIILKPSYQQKGVGRSVMSHIQGIAKEKSLPLRLSVIKANPVKPFYLKLGFCQYDEDDSFYKMQFGP
jgi:ribosomal protein S18 acetylase RimI-like enzyme